MVTEVWAEPQFGTLTDLNSELKYLEGLQYHQVPEAVCWIFLLLLMIGCTFLARFRNFHSLCFPSAVHQLIVLYVTKQSN